MLIEGWAGLWSDYGECRDAGYARIPVTMRVTEYEDGTIEAVNVTEIKFESFKAKGRVTSMVIFDAPRGGMPIRIRNDLPMPELQISPRLDA